MRILLANSSYRDRILQTYRTMMSTVQYQLRVTLYPSYVSLIHGKPIQKIHRHQWRLASEAEYSWMNTTINRLQPSQFPMITLRLTLDDDCSHHGSHHDHKNGRLASRPAPIRCNRFRCDHSFCRPSSSPRSTFFSFSLRRARSATSGAICLDTASIDLRVFKSSPCAWRNAFTPAEF